MRHFYLLLFSLLVYHTGMSQSFPLTFDAPEDANWMGFNGTTTAVVEDPEEMGNQVLQMIGGMADFDGASLALDTYVDLSDDNNNTITFRMYLPLDGSSSNEHLLKFEGGPSGATEMSFTTSGTGWQDVSVDFPAGLGTQFPIMVLFTDAGVGNTGTGTYYVDDFDGPLGDPIAADQVPSGPAPDPAASDNEVLSIYSDVNYSNQWVFDYAFGSSQGDVNLADMGTNNALKVDLEVSGYGQGTNEVTDISDYSSLRFDYWADSMSTELIFTLIDNNGMVAEYPYTIGSGMGADEALVNEEWQTVEIPLSNLEALGFSTEHFFQWKVDATSNLVSKVIYLDNIYFYRMETSTEDLEQGEQAAVFPNPANIGQSIYLPENSRELEVYNAAGKLVLETTSAVFATQGLTSGTYLLRITNDKGQVGVQRLILH